MTKRYNSFDSYLRERFGQKVYKLSVLSVDGGFTCPNRDGSLGRGGCVYCNNDSFVPPYARARFALEDQITRGMDYLRRRYRAGKFIVYFQAYTSTYGDVATLDELFGRALSHTDVVGLVVGTRGDCLDQEKLSLLERYARDRYVAVEYGVESIYDKTLRFANRAHDYNVVVDAIELTKGRGLDIGVHIIVGFPTETVCEMLHMATEISRLGVNTLKVHNLHVVKNTPLERIYREAPFPLFSYEEYLDFIVLFLEKLSPDIVIERLFTTTPRQLLVAPRWGLSPLQVLQGIERELERRDTYQGRLYGC